MVMGMITEKLKTENEILKMETRNGNQMVLFYFSQNRDVFLWSKINFAHLNFSLELVSC